MLWGNYNGTPIRTISILKGIETKLSAKNILYDKACDLVEDKVTQSYFSHTSFDGKKGFQATYWNNREMSGDSVINVLPNMKPNLPHPKQKTLFSNVVPPGI